MENKNKKRILIGVLLVLIVINLTALVTILYQGYIRKPEYRTEWKDKQKPDKNQQERVKHFVRKELGLSEEQFHNYCRFKDTNLKNSGLIWEKLIKSREEAIHEITSENPDTVKLAALADSIGLYHKKMQLEMNRHFLNVKKTLTPEQMPKFNEMLINMDRGDWHRPGRNKTPGGKQYRHGQKQNE